MHHVDMFYLTTSIFHLTIHVTTSAKINNARNYIYVRYHGNVECSRHSAFVNASLLRTDIRADVFPPQIRCHQNAGLLFAKSFGNEKVQIVPSSTKLAGVYLRFKKIVFKENVLDREIKNC